MLGTKLILVDGCLPRSGKSSISQFIWLHLQKHDLVATWFYEDQDPHMLHISKAIAQDDVARTSSQAATPDVDSNRLAEESAVLDESQLQHTKAIGRDEFARKSLQAWQSFVDSLRNVQQIVVLDSTLLQHPLTFLLLRCEDVLRDENADQEWLAAYYVDVQEVLKELSPTLIYLYHDDTAASLGKLYADRGAEWRQWHINLLTQSAIGRRRKAQGLDGAIAVLDYYRALNASLFSDFTIPKVVIDVAAGDWESYHKQIMDFLGLPLIEDEADSGQSFEQLVGTYQATDAGFKCAVQMSAGEITVNNLCEPLSEFKPLIPRTANDFLVRGAPVELSFDWLETEATWRMRILGSQEEHRGKVLLKHT